MQAKLHFHGLIDVVSMYTGSYTQSDCTESQRGAEFQLLLQEFFLES